MNGSELLELMGMIDPAYIESADNEYVTEKHRPWVKWRVLAASLCLAIVCGILAFNLFVPNKNAKIIKIDSIEEVSNRFNGTLLAQNLDLSDGYSPSIELSCSDGGGLDDPLSWESLSVSAEYPDCAVVLNCLFEGQTDDNNTSAEIEYVEYGDIIVTIYAEDSEPECKYVQRAVFECGGVSYELIAHSNSADRIYELLDRLMGASGTDADTKSDFSSFTDILGFSNCKVKVDETAPHFFTWYFYTEIDGETRCIAEMFGHFDSNMPEAYSVDLDGNGIDELICNCVSGGDGWQTVIVYRNNNGVIEKGYIRQAFYDGLGAVNFGPGSSAEQYDPDLGFVITYYTETPQENDIQERKTATFKDGLENFDFYPYIPSVQ